MCIWLVHHHAASPEQPGITRHYSLARRLQASGYDVIIIASAFDRLTRQPIFLGPHETFRLQAIDGVRFFWLRATAYRRHIVRRALNMVTFAIRLMRYARLGTLPKPQVIWGSSPHLLAAWAAERLACMYDVPFILEVRDVWPQTLIDLGKYSPWHPGVKLLAAIESHLYRRADRIISALPYASTHMAQRGADIAKIVWIPNGVDFSLVPPPTPPCQDSNAPFTVMYAGAHGLANNIELILQAAAFLSTRRCTRSIQFRFIGDGPEKPRLLQVAKRLGLQSVHFEPARPKSDIYACLASADVCVLTLKDAAVFRWGVSPNKLFDYMAAARPVICAVRAGNNLVEQARAGLCVPPDDPQAVADAIITLAGMSYQERWQMGLRGREYVEKHYNVDVLARRLEQEVLVPLLNTQAHRKAYRME